MAKSPFAVSPAHRYFRTLEECFLDWRGSPLTLGEGDWQLAREWFEQGVPIALVVETLEEIFERRDAEGKKKVVSLQYFRPAIESVWHQRQELVAPASPLETPDIDVTARLRALSRSLPPGLPQRASWEERLLGLAGSPEEVEQSLASLDSELRHSLQLAMPEAERAALETTVRASCDKLAGRLPKEELERAAQRLREQHLRRHWGLPVMSLFSPEALSE